MKKKKKLERMLLTRTQKIYLDSIKEFSKKKIKSLIK